jgi:plastocyanin
MNRVFQTISLQAAALVASGLLMATASVSIRAAAPAPATVRIDNFSFNAPLVTVKAGTTVTWINGDDIPHTVVSSNGLFKSKVLDTDDRFSFTFAKPGQFGYFCSLHPHMTGKIVVKA